MSEPAVSTSEATFRWDRLTYASTLSYCVLVAGLSVGVVLGELRAQFHLDGVTAALHGSTFGVGLLACGLWGPRFVDLVGRRMALSTSMSAVVVGVTLFCVGPAWQITLFGTVCSGTGCALLVLVMPGLISDHHGPNRAIAFSAVNGVPGLAALVFSFVIGAFLSAHLSWRWPYLSITGVFAVVLAVVALPVTVPEGARVGAYSLEHFRSRAVLVPWLFLVNSTLVEFPLGVWAVTYLHEVGHASAGLAPVLATSFAITMSVARMKIDVLVRWFGERTTALCYSFVLAGVIVLCVVPSLPVRAAALGLCGVGAGPLYPLTVDRFYVRVGDALDSATLSAYCALASGVAITIGPLALGVLSDVADLRWAVLVVPALAVVGLVTQRPKY